MQGRSFPRGFRRERGDASRREPGGHLVFHDRLGIAQRGERGNRIAHRHRGSGRLGGYPHGPGCRDHARSFHDGGLGRIRNGRDRPGGGRPARSHGAALRGERGGNEGAGRWRRLGISPRDRRLRRRSREDRAGPNRDHLGDLRGVLHHPGVDQLDRRRIRRGFDGRRSGRGTNRDGGLRHYAVRRDRCVMPWRRVRIFRRKRLPLKGLRKNRPRVRAGRRKRRAGGNGRRGFGHLESANHGSFRRNAGLTQRDADPAPNGDCLALRVFGSQDPCNAPCVDQGRDHIGHAPVASRDARQWSAGKVRSTILSLPAERRISMTAMTRVESACPSALT